MKTPSTQRWYSLHEDLAAQIKVHPANDQRQACAYLQVDDLSKFCAKLKVTAQDFCEKARQNGFNLSSSSSKSSLQFLYQGQPGSSDQERKFKMDDLKAIIPSEFIQIKDNVATSSIYSNDSSAPSNVRIWKNAMLHNMSQQNSEIFMIRNDKGSIKPTFQSYNESLDDTAHPLFLPKLKAAQFPLQELDALGYKPSKSLISYYPSKNLALQAGHHIDDVVATKLAPQSMPMSIEADGRIHAFANFIKIPELINDISKNYEQFTPYLSMGQHLVKLRQVAGVLPPTLEKLENISESKTVPSDEKKHIMLATFSEMNRQFFEAENGMKGLANNTKNEYLNFSLKENDGWYAQRISNTNQVIAEKPLDSKNIEAVVDNFAGRYTNTSNLLVNPKLEVSSLLFVNDLISRLQPLKTLYGIQPDKDVSKVLQESKILSSSEFSRVDESVLKPGIQMSAEIQTLHNYHQQLVLGRIPFATHETQELSNSIQQIKTDISAMYSAKLLNEVKTQIPFDEFNAVTTNNANKLREAQVDHLNKDAQRINYNDQLNAVVTLKREFFHPEFVSSLVANEKYAESDSLVLSTEHHAKQIYQQVADGSAPEINSNLIDTIKGMDNSNVFGNTSVESVFYPEAEPLTYVKYHEATPLTVDKVIQENQQNDEALSNKILPDAFIDRIVDTFNVSTNILIKARDALESSDNAWSLQEDSLGIALDLKRQLLRLEHLSQFTGVDVIKQLSGSEFTHDVMRHLTANDGSAPVNPTLPFGYNNTHILLAVKDLAMNLPSQLGEHQHLPNIVGMSNVIQTQTNVLLDQITSFQSKAEYQTGLAQHFINKYIPSTYDKADIYNKDGAFVVNDITSKHPFALSKLGVDEQPLPNQKMLAATSLDAAASEAYSHFKKVTLLNSLGLGGQNDDQISSLTKSLLTPDGNIAEKSDQIKQYLGTGKNGISLSADDINGDFGLNAKYSPDELKITTESNKDITFNNSSDYMQFKHKFTLMQVSLVAHDPELFKADVNKQIPIAIVKQLTADAEFKQVWAYNKPNSFEINNKITSTNADSLLLNRGNTLTGALKHMADNSAYLNLGSELTERQGALQPLMTYQQDLTTMRLLPLKSAQIMSYLDLYASQQKREFPEHIKQTEKNRVVMRAYNYQHSQYDTELVKQSIRDEKNSAYPLLPRNSAANIGAVSAAVVTADLKGGVNTPEKLAEKAFSQLSDAFKQELADYASKMEKGSQVAFTRMHVYASAPDSTNPTISVQMPYQSPPKDQTLIETIPIDQFTERAVALTLSNHFSEAPAFTQRNTPTSVDPVAFDATTAALKEKLSSAVSMDDADIRTFYLKTTAIDYGKESERALLDSAYIIREKSSGLIQVAYPKDNNTPIASDNRFAAEKVPITTIDRPLFRAIPNIIKTNILDRTAAVVDKLDMSTIDRKVEPSTTLRSAVTNNAFQAALLTEKFIKQGFTTATRDELFKNTNTSAFFTYGQMAVLYNPAPDVAKPIEVVYADPKSISDKISKGAVLASLPHHHHDLRDITSHALAALESKYDLERLHPAPVVEPKPTPTAPSAPTETTRKAKSNGSSVDPNRIEDTGLKVPGAIKDQYRNTLSFSQIKERTQEELHELIKLAKIWPKTSSVKAEESGVSASTYLMQQSIKKLIPATPVLPKSIVSSDSLYVAFGAYNKMVSDLRDAFNDKKTIVDTQLAIAQMHLEWNKPENAQFISVANKLYRPLTRTVERITTNAAAAIAAAPKDVNKQSELLSTYDSSYDSYKKLRTMLNAVSFRSRAKLASGDVSISDLSDNLSPRIQKRIYFGLSPANTPDPDNPNAPVEKAKPKPKRDDYTKELTKELSRLLKDQVRLVDSRKNIREYESDRHGRDITAKELQERFGFKSIEFGNYVTQKERQEDLNFAYDGCTTLTKLLKVEERLISLDGHLSLANGSRGRGGNACAHYEPTTGAINLTKNSGFGSFGHEWFHALDHHLTKVELHRNPAQQIKAGLGGSLLSTHVGGISRYAMTTETPLKQKMAEFVTSMRSSNFKNETLANIKPMLEEHKAVVSKRIESLIQRTELYSPKLAKLISREYERNQTPEIDGGLHIDSMVNDKSNVLALQDTTTRGGLRGAIIKDTFTLHEKIFGEKLRKEIRLEPDLEDRKRMVETFNSPFVIKLLSAALKEDMDNIYVTRSLSMLEKAHPNLFKADVSNPAQAVVEKEILAGFMDATKSPAFNVSQFHRDSLILDGTTSKPYYATAHEQFARTGEAIMVEMLKKEKTTNDWLVTPEHIRGDFLGLNLRPMKAERERIISKFETDLLPLAMQEVKETMAELRQSDIVRDLKRDLSYLQIAPSGLVSESEIKQIEDNIVRASSPEFLVQLKERDKELTAKYEVGEKPVIDRNDSGLFTYTAVMRSVQDEQNSNKQKSPTTTKKSDDELDFGRQ